MCLWRFSDHSLINLFSYFCILRGFGGFFFFFCIFLKTVLFQVCVFSKYFLSVCRLSSHSLDTIFCRAKVLHFNNSSLSIISFMDCDFSILSKKSLSYPRSSNFSPMSSSRSFIVLHFIFGSLVHTELTFMKVVRSVSRFLFLTCDIQSFQHHLLKRLAYCLCAPVRDLLTIACGSISGPSILFHWSFLCILLNRKNTILSWLL